MIIGINNVIEFVRMNDAPYWKIHSKGSTVDTITEIQKESISLEESLEILKKSLCLLAPNTYGILARKAPSKVQNKSDIYKSNFSIHTNDPSYTANNVAGTPQLVQHTSPEEIAQMVSDGVEKKLREIEVERELKELRERNKELEARSFSSHLGTAIGALSPYIPGLMDKLGISKIASPQIGSISDANQTQKHMPLEKNNVQNELNSDEQRIESALTLMLNSGVTIEDLELIAHAVSENPKLINTVRSFLS